MNKGLIERLTDDIVCGARGFAGPSCCILKPGHEGEHEYGIPPQRTPLEHEAAAELSRLQSELADYQQGAAVEAHEADSLRRELAEEKAARERLTRLYDQAINEAEWADERVASLRAQLEEREKALREVADASRELAEAVIEGTVLVAAGEAMIDQLEKQNG